jgi:GNAT superfamily N-acetyltransferase
LKTGDKGKDALALFNDPYVIGQYYAAPYLLYPKGVCFVVEYEYRPQGYIIAADTADFSRWMEEVWLPPLRERYPRPFPPKIICSESEEKIVKTIHKSCLPLDDEEKLLCKDYPAHLHIDLLPGLQGKGMGRALINKLCEELAQMGIPGVSLGVDKENKNAAAFYLKVGFSVLHEEKWGSIMGMKIKR